MHPIFKFGIFLIFLEFCYALYWIVTMFYVLIPGNANDSLISFHAFLLSHTLVITLTIYWVIEGRYQKPKIIFLFPFGLELFYDLYGLLSAIRYLDRSFVVAFNIQYAGTIWSFSLSCLVLLWFLVLVMTGIKEERKVKPKSFY